MNKSKIKPNLFIVGQPKSGTTALYHFLKEHPQIYMSEVKEPNYFCKDHHKESDLFHGKIKLFKRMRTEEQYLSIFSKWKGEKIIGEASPSYLYSKVAAENIFHFNPNARIIMLFREPVDFLQSFHSEAQASLDEDISDFAKALSLENERKLGKNLPKGIRRPSKIFYSDRVKYSEQINRYLSFFPSSKIKVIIYDDFKENNEKVFADILDFLLIERTIDIKFKKFNPNKQIRFQNLRCFLKLVNTIVGFIKFIYPDIICQRDRLYSIYKRIFFKQVHRRPIDSKLNSRLKRQFKKEVACLSKILERDLVELWGYDKV